MLDFPANPTIGQVFASGGVTWIWDGAKWTLSAVPGGGTSITIGDIPPTNPAVGALWWHSASGQLYVFYNDGTSSQWVPTTNQMGGGYATTAYVDAARLGDNRIINGDMRIDQRNNGASGTAIQAYTLDRWFYNAPAVKGSWGQYTNPSTFPYHYGFASSSSYASAAGDFFMLMQAIEADMISDFAWGTVNAQPVTLSFMVSCSQTGTFSGSLRNDTPNRSYPFTFSVPVANTWTRIVITIPGDTGGTWNAHGNGLGLYLTFDLGCGSTYRAPAGAWITGNFGGANGSVSTVAVNGANFNITGVKLEIGSVATPFNRQSLAKSLADCQRYYQSFPSFMISGYNTGGQSILSQPIFPVCMRASPTAGGVGLTAPTYSNASGLTVNYVDAASVRLQMSITATGLGWGQVAPLTLSAEL